MTAATKVENIWCKRGSDHSLFGFGICFPHFHHDFAMSLFYPQIRMNTFNKFIKRFTSYVSFKNIASIKVPSFLRYNLSPIVKAKKIFKPNHYGFVDRRKLQNSTVNNWEFPSFGFNGVDVKTSVPVYVASKIRKVKLIIHYVNSCITVYINHKLSSTVNDLGEWNSERNMRKSDLIREYERDLRRGNPAKSASSGHKSNRMPVLNSAAARLGQSYRETSDVLQRDNLEATASIINCIGGGNGDLPTQMAVSDVDDVVALLQNNDGEYVTSAMGGQDKIGTSPIGDSYGALCSARMIPVLNSMAGFIRKFQYPNIDKTLSSEWGGINNVRFFISSQGSVTANASALGNDVGNNFVCAREGYKVVFQAGGRAKFIYLPPGYNNDPGLLRHTTACTFNKQDVGKSSLIDLETYESTDCEYALAA